MGKNILLTISVLASNRRETTEKCLKSLDHLRKTVPCELIITDTGCDEEMRKLVDSYADSVIEFTWCNDFAKARQVSLDAAQGEWYLYLDDDEWFIDTVELEKFFQCDQHERMGFATYIQRNYHDWDGETYADTWVGRMIKVTPDARFEDKIHEHLEPIAGRNVAAIGSIVEHYGYLHKNKADEFKHYERNRTLLLEMIQEDPENLRARCHLAQEYRAMAKFPELLEICQEGIELTKDSKKREERTDIGGFHAGKLIALEGMGRFEEAKAACLEAKKDKRIPDTTIAFVDLYEANADMELGPDYASMEKNCRDYLSLQKKLDDHPVEKFMESISVFSGHAFDEDQQERLYSMLLLAVLHRNDLSEAVEYVGKLGWEKQNIYIHKGLLEGIVFAMSKPYSEFTGCESEADFRKKWEEIIAILRQNNEIWGRCIGLALQWEQSPQLDETLILKKVGWTSQSDWFVSYCKMRTIDGRTLEPWFLSMPFAEWKLELEDYYANRGYGAMLELKDYFSQIKSGDDLRYIYLDLYMMQLAILNAGKDLSLADRKKQMLEYAQLMAALGQTFPADVNGNEVEAAGCLLAACTTENLEEALSAFHKTAELNPKLAPAIKQYLSLEEQTRRAQSDAAKKEMEALRGQILKQAQSLMDAGQMGEANAILSQLKTMIPNDLEITEMALKTCL